MANVLHGTGLDSDDDSGNASPARIAPDSLTDPLDALKAAGLDSGDYDGDDADADQQDAEPPVHTAASSPQPASAPPQRTALQAAGLEDSDDENAQAERPAAAAKDADDEFDAVIEEVPAPGSETVGSQRVIGPPEEWDLPLVRRPDKKVYIMNFKSMLDIESEPYNSDKFTLKDSKNQYDESGRVIPRAPVLNRLRWRFAAEAPETGILKMESTARIVRWSDGSMSLFVGDECVDVAVTPLDGKHMCLAAFHEGSDVLQAQALIDTRLALRPPDVESKLHKNLTMQPSPSKTGVTGIKASAVLGDFQRDHEEAIGRDHESIKLKERQERRIRKHAPSFAALHHKPPPRRTVDAAYLEADDGEEDDDDDYDVGRPYSTRRSQLDADAEAEREKRLLQAKHSSAGKRKHTVLGDDDEDDVVLSDDEVPIEPVTKPAKKQLTLDDSDDDFG